MKNALKASALAGGLALISLPAHALPSFYVQSNLVTSNQGILTGLGYAPAANVDPDLLNPWGISSRVCTQLGIPSEKRP